MSAVARVERASFSAWVLWLAVVLLAWLPCGADAQDTEWNRLTREGAAHYKAERFREAVTSATAALKAAQRDFGSDDLRVATGLDHLALACRRAGGCVAVDRLYARALAIRQKALKPNDPLIASTSHDLALLQQAQGRYGAAEPLLKNALAIWEATQGPESLHVAGVLHTLGLLHFDMGRYAEADSAYRRSLAIRERINGPDDPSAATLLLMMSLLYQTRGQYALAEPLAQRALTIRQQAAGSDSDPVAHAMNVLGELKAAMGQRDEAEALFGKVLELRAKASRRDPARFAQTLTNLAHLHVANGQFARAEPLYRQAVAPYEQSVGPGHPYLAGALQGLADACQGQQRHAQAHALYQRALLIWQGSRGAEHPYVAANLNAQAASYMAQGQPVQALETVRRASAMVRKRIVAGDTGDSAPREAARNATGFYQHLSLLARNPANQPAAAIADESLQILQLAHSSGTASAIAKMAARFASGSDALALLAKRRQDAAEQVARLEAQRVVASAMAPEQRDAEVERARRDELEATAALIRSLDTELEQRFPRYAELIRTQPVALEQVRALLRPGEAVLAYAMGSPSYAWLVRSEEARFLALAVDSAEVRADVRAVRAQMELASGNKPRPVDLAALHRLYKGLLAPLESALGQVEHLIVIPHGALESLPFSMLVTKPPPDILGPADYRQVDWLARRYAISVLPSVGSIQALRQIAKPVGAAEPFIGFGDPLTGEAPRADLRSRPALAGPGISDVNLLRQAPRLKETADELRALARILAAGPNALWLQADATETHVKRLDLSRYRVVAFATHGLMAGQVSGIGEPGLILTPPTTGTVEDDGYLAAGEIAKLRLDADWVILSACDTAASDGTPGAEGLSGLAKAFFYAGARSLLVSHWPVVSAATVPLTTWMLKEYEAHPGLGKAQAQRKAMLALMNSPTRPEYAHPLYWAPFVVVGEGR